MLFVIILGKNSVQCIRTIFYNSVNCLLDETKMFSSMGSKYFSRITKIRTESLRCQTAVFHCFAQKHPDSYLFWLSHFSFNFLHRFKCFHVPGTTAHHQQGMFSLYPPDGKAPASISLVLPAQSKPRSWSARTDSHILPYLCRAVGSPQPPLPFRILCSFSTDFYIWHCRYISHSRE